MRWTTVEGSDPIEKGSNETSLTLLEVAAGASAEELLRPLIGLEKTDVADPFAVGTRGAQVVSMVEVRRTWLLECPLRQGRLDITET